MVRRNVDPSGPMLALVFRWAVSGLVAVLVAVGLFFSGMVQANADDIDTLQISDAENTLRFQAIMTAVAANGEAVKELVKTVQDIQISKAAEHATSDTSAD